MVGIYKITSPTGRVYIGQSIDLLRRQFEYLKLNKCKGQPRLYASLVKYGFSEHIFEVVEECSVEELNTRERHWQDFYNVLSKKGLNCRLTGTQGNSGYLSEQTKQNQSRSKKVFFQTEEGRKAINKRLVNTDFKTRTLNTDYSSRTANTDYKSFQKRKVLNTDYTRIAKKHMKPVNQYNKDGTYIREWSSIKEAGEATKTHRTDITQCCKGKYKSAGGFIWKYK